MLYLQKSLLGSDEILFITDKDGSIFYKLLLDTMVELKETYTTEYVRLIRIGVEKYTDSLEEMSRLIHDVDSFVKENKRG